MLEINNLTNFSVDNKSFSQVAKKVLIGENREIENISLAFVSEEEIHKLNKKFRNKDKPTDVLSFNLDEKDCLGDIIICPEVVAKNAKEQGVSENYETMKVFIHGILHLLGYDHEKTEQEAELMEEKQNKYLKGIK
jgi:probable rRNA maturation factor